MHVDELMERLDRLDHHERQAELVAQVGGLGPAEAEALQRALLAEDVHRRRLGLLVAQVRGDLEPAWVALEDPSLSVRRSAAQWVGRAAPSIAAQWLDRIDVVTCGVLLQQVVRRNRREIADGLVSALCERGRLREASYALSAATEGFIVATLDAEAWPDDTWTRLAKHRPAVMMDRLRRAFADEPERPDLVWRRFSSGVFSLLADREPEALAELVDRHADADTLPPSLGVALPALVRWSAARVLGWLQARPSWAARMGLPAGLARRARELPDASLLPLCTELLRDAPQRFVDLVAELPHLRRGSLFEAGTASLSTERSEWPVTLLAALPESLRDREAARMLGLQRALADASWRRTLLGYRSIEHARPLLEQEGRSANAVDRAEAHAALVGSAARSRRGMAQALEWLQRIRNEQDPVRLAVLGALARVPGQQLDDREALDAVVAPIFDARDTSYATRQAAALIAKRLMIANATAPSSPMFELGVSLLARLAGQGGTLDLPSLHPNLPRGAEQAIVDALMPWLEADGARQRVQGITRLWMALGKRAWEVPSLQELVERLIWEGRKDDASHLAERWIEDPRTRDERVRALIDRDRSALYLVGAFWHCHRRRQQRLLDRFTGPVPKGRFHDGKVVVVPTVQGGLDRWTPELQRAFLAVVAAAEGEPKRNAWSRAMLLDQRARVPLTEVADLQRYLGSDDVNMVEAALGAMVWTDRPAPALPILLEHLDGDRARVAMYAMPRLARLLPAARVVDALRELLARPKLRVTVHKEALRLLGQYPTEEATALLLRVWGQPLHRDVRIAALHAARGVLGQPRAWELLASAATDESPDVVRAVVEVAVVNVAQAYRRRYLEVMMRVAEHPDPTARAALFGALRQGWSLAAVEEATALAAGVVGRLDPLDPWREALAVLVDGARSAAAHGAIVGLVEGLIDALRIDVAPAGERDQLPLQRLDATMEGLQAQRHPGAMVLLVELAQRLRAEPLAWALGVHADVAAASNEALAELLLARLRDAPSPRSRRAVEQAAAAAAEQVSRQWSETEGLAIVDALCGASNDARLVAVAMLRSLGPRWSWGPAWTERLARLREDPGLDVRLAARRLFLARA
ncbi:MAG: HEAT repeat domain-containing protein [Myxococcales bacterium]|nr:HEAT repeat domain-containing protein [Myxococcales bacterium]